MIYVFKTTVKTEKAVKQLAPKLNDHFPASKWNFDLHDRDHILRIDSQSNIAEQIKSLLLENGFDCMELPD